MAEHVANVVAKFFARGGRTRAYRRAAAVVAWPEIVGATLARFAVARSVRDRTLFVDVSDSETAMHLSLQRPRFLRAYAERFGPGVIQDVRFVAGRPADRAPGGPPPPEPSGSAGSAGDDAAPPAPVDADERERLLASLGRLELPEAVATPALEAGEAWLRHRARAEAAGWTPCPHCGALSPDPGPCDACRRYRAAPAVRRAAERLRVDPAAATPDLSEDERRVAAALAVEALDEALLGLLPQVLASPALAPQLREAATVRLALSEDKPREAVDAADVDRLDARVARALGRWGAGAGEDGT